MKAVILADGDASPRAALDVAWPGWAEGIELVIAADGGARHAADLGLTVDIWVGDGDSVDPDALGALEAAGVELRRSAAAKDESDTELAVTAALERGATAIIVLGAFGGRRFDHALANVGLLALPGLGSGAMTLLDAATRIRLLRATGDRSDAATLELAGRAGDLVSLLPFGPGVEGVTTDGLEWPLRDEPLPAGPARGLSNVRAAAVASVSVRRGLLLVVETPATLRP
jgi:thiamine pyrophosphokinase